MSCSLNLQFTPRISSSWHSLKVANLTERIPTQFIFANEQLTRWKFENDLAWDILKSKSKGDPFKGFLEEHTASHVVDQDQDLRKSCSSERKLPIFPPFTVHLKLGSQARGIDMFKTLRDFRVLMRIGKLASHVKVDIFQSTNMRKLSRVQHEYTRTKPHYDPNYGWLQMFQ